MMQSFIRKDAFPADTAQIDLYHVDAGFFVCRVLSQIFLCAQSEILALFPIARRTGPSVTGRLSNVCTAFDLDKQNMGFILADNIGLQMTAAIIAM